MPTPRPVLIALAMLMLCVTTAAPAAQDAKAGQAGEFPEHWYWGERPEEHKRFEGRAAPKLTVGEWSGGNFKPEDMKGKITVVHFWATWCTPCKKTMPLNSKLAKDYASENVKVIGVCTSGEASKIAAIQKEHKANYPNAFIKGEQVVKDWPVLWYPTYAVVDGEGTVRAIGLKADRVQDVVEVLLTEQAKNEGRVRIRPDWMEGSPDTRKRLSKIDQSDAPPALNVTNWMNTGDKEMTLAGLKGKVVVIDFWATWSSACEKAVEKHNALYKKYADKGLVIIGVCNSLKGEFMAQSVKKNEIAYPVCLDNENKTAVAYSVDGYPDYYIIDRSGKLRIPDCKNESLEAAVTALLGEKVKEAGKDKSGDKEVAKDDVEVEGD